MGIGPDPRDWSENDWVDREFIDYSLSSSEKKSLDAIEGNVKNNAYTLPKDCFAHMQLLEHLSNKLKDIISNERSIGKANWDVEQAYKDIKTLYGELSSIHKELSRK